MKVKKILTHVLVFLVATQLLISPLLVIPRFANASVPVHEYYLTGLVPGQGGTLPGEFAAKESNLAASPLSIFKKGWDAVAWFFAKLIIHELTKAMVLWIRTGQDPAFFAGTEGSLFITNIDEFLLDAADNQASLMLRDYFGPAWNTLCTPFRLPVGLGLSQSYGRGYGTFGPKARCSITDILGIGGNLDNYYANFANGGWDAWIKTSRYENTAWGLLAIAEEESRERETRAVRAGQNDVLAGLGFPGDRTCVEAVHISGAVIQNPDMSSQDAVAGNLRCNRYITKTPGKAVEDQVVNVYGNEWRSLEIADEIDELLSALFSALLTWILSGGSQDGLLGGPIQNAQPPNDNFGGNTGNQCAQQTGRGVGCQCTPGAQQCGVGLTCLPGGTCGASIPQGPGTTPPSPPPGPPPPSNGGGTTPPPPPPIGL